ncbi:PQQ-dependent sugar dehydrogenase [Marivita cryptomonadis]|uniref:PQQ-dependent sugar dehydrogenase n=3 Tax=Marivita TaxID=659428 RepID=A0A9Q2P0J8_9RHOB|nr:PQQ-dependent sugar dehydrogenase [Marivita cryptomonadis]MBM2333898.1 PQQ-dependent sugar dehydrogenase [Marivita cryptomonadis]MBM2343470.1 PQQ-dependent sugar dehydrogenase [Marivita cryptomonadis]MBM2348146.1 PQQ-dependent sugar dehydrogenase [Marivita cryptomonadis]MBM2352825.1 PQQ-dependent sugar dehydrogenase [Marivita cryptomonadis]
MIRSMTTTTALAMCLAAPAAAQETHSWGAKNADFEPAFENQTRAELAQSDLTFEYRQITEGLEHPWAVAELPDGAGLLVTERPGRLVHVSLDGDVSEPISGLPEIFNQSAGNSTQAGLLDVKVGPNFAEDRMIYFTYAKGKGDGMSVTAAGRGVLSEDMTALTDVMDIFEQTPPSPAAMHYGSRIVFDGKGHAFITTGEHFTDEEREKAQGLDNTYGKVVRVDLDGSVPDDNPFVGQEGAEASIWSYGHRNIQGAAMRGEQLFIVEHGPAGGDEINIPQAGLNYGWPVVSYGVRYDGEDIGTGGAQAEGMAEPAYYWDPVIAPGDMLFYDGTLMSGWQGDSLVAGLVAPGVVRLEWDGDRVSSEERLFTEYGRVRDIEELSDGSLILATDYENGGLIHVTIGGSGS